MSLRVGSALNFKQVSSTPGETPASGEILLYSNTGDVLIAKPNDNIERRVATTRYVRVSTTASITLSGTQTIDGVALGVGDRVLVRHQGVFSGTSTVNGVYVVASGAWTRAPDASTAAQLAWARFEVTDGTAFAGAIFTCAFTSTSVLGTDGIAFLLSNRMDVGASVFALPAASSLSDGQEFFNSADRLLRFWSGTAWRFPKGIPDYASTAPANPVTGELWIDSSDSGPAGGSYLIVTSSTRPGQSKGLQIYETDTDRVYVSDGTSWRYLYGGTDPTAARAYAGTSTSLVSANFVAIALNTEEYDYGNNFASNAYTCPRAGQLQVSGSVQFSSGAGERNVGSIFKNGTTEVARGTDGSAAAGNSGVHVSSVITVAASDVITLQVWTNGTGRTTTAGSSLTYMTCRMLP